MENVAEFLENIDNNLTYYEIPTQLACAYLKGHLTGWALDWFEALGYGVVEDKATDYAHLKLALTEQFPVENWRETRGNNRYSDNSRSQREFNRFEGQGVSDNRRFDSRRRGGQSDHTFHNQGGRQGSPRNGAFRGQDDQNRHLNFKAIDASLGVIDREVQKIFPIRNTVLLG
ncbi:uncharacterized protein TNCV_1639421 [Trichonephila clavipes]|nr:uncharacterized protein TNCV_1639421 [Trichonephila clavipes]